MLGKVCQAGSQDVEKVVGSFTSRPVDNRQRENMSQDLKWDSEFTKPLNSETPFPISSYLLQ